MAHLYELQTVTIDDYQPLAQPPATEAIARVAEALDRITGDPTWDERIDLDRLEMHNAARCILGQAFGELDGFNDMSRTLVMDGWVDRPTWRVAVGGRPVEPEWRELITARRAARNERAERKGRDLRKVAALTGLLTLVAALLPG